MGGGYDDARRSNNSQSPVDLGRSKQKPAQSSTSATRRRPASSSQNTRKNTKRAFTLQDENHVEVGRSSAIGTAHNTAQDQEIRNLKFEL